MLGYLNLDHVIQVKLRQDVSSYVRLS